MTDRTIEALKQRLAIAEEATPGPWTQGKQPCEDTVYVGGDNEAAYSCSIGDFHEPVDTAHCAASSPDVVAADIREIIALREERDHAIKVLRDQEFREQLYIEDTRTEMTREVERAAHWQNNLYPAFLEEYRVEVERLRARVEELEEENSMRQDAHCYCNGHDRGECQDCGQPHGGKCSK